MASLASLLEQSQRLQQSHVDGHHELPSIQLGLDQIESQSRKIAGRSLKDPSAHSGNAAYILASGGVNADQLSSHINTLNPSVTFEPLLPLSDTDIEGYLKHTHEQTIISAIEEGRRHTQQDFYRRLANQSRAAWEKQKDTLFEELGRHHLAAHPPSSSNDGTPARKKLAFERGNPALAAPSTSGGASSLQMHSKMMRYDLVIRRLNQFRREGYAFGLVSALGEASVSPSTSSSQDTKSSQTTETWRLLAHLVQERDVLNGEFQRKALQERCYATAYLNQDNSSEAGELRRTITAGGKNYLEEQFMNHVEKTLASRPTEANLGGIPSIQNKIRAFLNVKYLKNGNWSNSSLEIANSTPIWARIYYLLRAGHSKEALEFAIENERAIEGLEKSFVAYFKAWLDSPDRRLPKLLRDRFLAEYNQRIRYTSSSSDPYKQALYKLIGRVELNRRNVAGVTQTTEDWLWFQLSLIREEGGTNDTRQQEGAFEQYGSQELATVLRKFGESHFDPKGNRPLLYFQVLLISGQFELAIAFLQQHGQYQADAVHYAIALEYYGLLRVPARSKVADVELLVDGSSSTPALSFSRLIHRYTRSFVHTDALEALQYLYLICLNADLPGDRGREQVELAHEYVRELVMETRQYSALLGDVRNDGTKIPGEIEKDLKLLHLPDARTYLLSIVKSAAQRADTEQRFSEAVLLYNLAEEYDAVIAVLNLELSNSLSKPSGSIVNETGGSLDGNAYFGTRGGGDSSRGTIGMTAAMGGAGQDVTQIAKSILEHYDRSTSMSSRVGRKRRETCQVLMRLKEAMIAYEQSKFEQALQTIESTSLLPLSSDLVTIIRASEDLKDLDDTIVRNLDIILLTTMTILYKLHQQLKDSPFGGDQSRQHKMIELRSKGRSLMMFAGMLRYRLTSETYSQLTRLDVFLH
ncbi:linker nucleoporin NIC96 [Sporobolomyces koalae]|uniref:linker nucleoporin NIC96 n=1 Tax=Sporobolomyces koalae TaxID=500713 RepID=UPI0031799DEA